MTALTPSQIDEFLAFTHRLADAAGAITLKHFRTALAVDNKRAQGFDPVTLADKGAEAAIRALIEATYPEHGIFGEEHGKRASASGLTWVIDPIDGTRSFIIGSPLWGTLIALSDAAGPIIGVLDQPFLGERFFAVRGGASSYTRGGRTLRLTTRPCAKLDDAILSTTTTEVFATAQELRAFNTLSGAARLTRYGGDCYQYGLLAMGFVDLVVESTLQPYDIHALIPIIQGAGGMVTSWEGAPAQDGGRIVAAGDARVHAAALKVLQAGLH